MLTGYMRKIGPRTLRTFRGRLLNTHPALLPKFGGRGMYGMHVHRAVLASGDAVTGASVHWVDAEYDTGAVIDRREVPWQRATPRRRSPPGCRWLSAHSWWTCWHASREGRSGRRYESLTTATPRAQRTDADQRAVNDLLRRSPRW